jgi:hypothetical protein
LRAGRARDRTVFCPMEKREIDSWRKVPASAGMAGAEFQVQCAGNLARV